MTVLAPFLTKRIKRDTLPILLFIVVFAVMSYPLLFKLGDIVPFLNGDTYQASWLNWWTWEALSTGQDYNFTPLLFAPNGLDYSLQPPRYPALPIWIGFYELFGEPIAYNLSVAVEVIIKAYGMYLLGLYLFKRRISAWVSGAFYAFGSMSLQMALQQPYTGSTEWIPFFMLAYIYGIDLIRKRARPKAIFGVMVLSGFLFLLSFYMNIKIGIFAMLIGGGYVLFAFVWHGLWSRVMFWGGMVIFALTVLVFAIPLLMPFIVSDDFDNAVSFDAKDKYLDVMIFAKHRLDRPLAFSRSIGALADDLEWPVSTHERVPTVGIVGIVFALMGTLYAIRRDRVVLSWVLLTVVFWVLSLGPSVYLNYQLILETAPVSYIMDTAFMGILRNTQRFAMLFFFTFSVLVGYGLLYRLETLTLTRKQMVLLGVSVSMLLYGTSVFPIPYREHVKPSYVDVLNELPSGSVVYLPLGRFNAKYYMSIQRFHGRPMIEGMIGRTPDGTYDYIDSIGALSLFDGSADDTILDHADVVWDASMRQLLDDGFRYLIIHKYVWAVPWDFVTPSSYFDVMAGYPMVYEDDDVQIYDIEMLVTQ